MWNPAIHRSRSHFASLQSYTSRHLVMWDRTPCPSCWWYNSSLLRANHKHSMVYYHMVYFPELPWDRPTTDCAPYKMWKEGRYYGMPWTKLDINALNFIKRILSPQASKRITVDQINAHVWMNKRLTGCKFVSSLCIKSAHRGFASLYASFRHWAIPTCWILIAAQSLVRYFCDSDCLV